MDGIKVYVDVLASFDPAGQIRPLMILWEDGRKYRIQRVLDVRSAPALRAGGRGDRYTIRINGKESYLFFEHSLPGERTIGKWFVERRSV